MKTESDFENWQMSAKDRWLLRANRTDYGLLFTDVAERWGDHLAGMADLERKRNLEKVYPEHSVFNKIVAKMGTASIEHSKKVWVQPKVMQGQDWKDLTVDDGITWTVKTANTPAPKSAVLPRPIPQACPERQKFAGTPPHFYVRPCPGT